MEDIMNAGIQAIIIIGILVVLMMIILHVMAQRSQQHMSEMGMASLLDMHRLGISAIIGANEMKIVDDSLSNHKVSATAQTTGTTATAQGP